MRRYSGNAKKIEEARVERAAEDNDLQIVHDMLAKTSCSTALKRHLEAFKAEVSAKRPRAAGC